MGYLMSHHNGQRCLVLRDREQALVDADQSTGHTPGIDILVLHQVELPLVVLHILGHAIVLQVGLHSCRQPLPYPLHHSRIGCIGRRLGSLHILTILLGRQAEHLTVGYQQVLLTSRNRHRLGRSAAYQHGSQQRQQ